MSHIVDTLKPVPFGCEDCVHVDPNDPFRCRAFDVIPIEFFDIGEKHIEKLEGQKGDFVFEPKSERQYNRVYETEA